MFQLIPPYFCFLLSEFTQTLHKNAAACGSECNTLQTANATKSQFGEEDIVAQAPPTQSPTGGGGPTWTRKPSPEPTPKPTKRGKGGKSKRTNPPSTEPTVKPTKRAKGQKSSKSPIPWPTLGKSGKSKSPAPHPTHDPKGRGGYGKSRTGSHKPTIYQKMTSTKSQKSSKSSRLRGGRARQHTSETTSLHLPVSSDEDISESRVRKRTSVSASPEAVIYELKDDSREHILQTTSSFHLPGSSDGDIIDARVRKRTSVATSPEVAIYELKDDSSHSQAESYQAYHPLRKRAHQLKEHELKIKQQQPWNKSNPERRRFPRIDQSQLKIPDETFVFTVPDQRSLTIGNIQSQTHYPSNQVRRKLSRRTLNREHQI